MLNIFIKVISQWNDVTVETKKNDVTRAAPLSNFTKMLSSALSSHFFGVSECEVAMRRHLNSYRSFFEIWQHMKNK